MIDATLADMRSPSSFQRFINDQVDGRASRDKSVYQQQKEDSAHLQRRPARSTEHMMEHVKSGKLVQIHHTKGSGHGPPPTSQQGAFQQDEDLSPGGASEPISKGSQKYSEQMRGQQGSLLVFSSNRPHHTESDKGIRKNCAKSRHTMYHIM